MLYINFTFYADVAGNYESSRLAALYANEHYPETKTVAVGGFIAQNFIFQANQEVARHTSLESLMKESSKEDLLIYTDEWGLKQIKRAALPICTTKTFDYFRVSQLNLKFINHKSRIETLQNRYLLLVNMEGCL